MTIVCPHCKKEVPIEDALKHQMAEGLVKAEREKFELELAKAKKETTESAEKKIREQFEISIKNSQAEIKETKKRNQELSGNLLELSKQMREISRKSEDSKLAMEKEMAEEESKIRETERKKAEEEQHLKNLEREKQLQDALKANEDLRRKLEQGSQQTQGEALELELERILRSEFPLDNISEVAKGVRGADIKQQVIDKNGSVCGVILWESKNAQWTDKWIAKLKEDQRELKADLAVLVSVNLPKESKTYQDGVWVVSPENMTAVATTLRFNLVQANFIRKAQEGKGEKAEALYAYLCSHEFRQRVEGMLEHYSNLQREMEQEKRWFGQKWARQEKSLRTMIDQTNGFYGDLQHLIGTDQLPQLESESNS